MIELVPEPEPKTLPAAPKGAVVLASPPFESGAFQLDEAQGGATLECDVLYPIDLTLTHGVNVRAEDLAAMVSSYDPEKEEAQLNFDHAWDGPSHGKCTRLLLNEGRLRARFENVSAEAVEGIRSGKWPRRSSEFTLHHPILGKPYFRGLALLGAARPGVPGLGPWQLMSDANVLVQLPEDPMKTDPKTDPNPTPTPDPTPDPAPPPEGGDKELSEKRRELEAALAETRKTLAAARRQRAEVDADNDIAKLGDRATPGMRKAGLRDLLVELGAADAPATIQLSENGKTVEKSVRSMFLGILEKVPPFVALSAGDLAVDDGDVPDGRSSDEIALHEAHGISPERIRELRRKFPSAAN